MGKWVSVASNNEAIGYSYLVGTTSASSTEHQSWMTDVMNHSMELGIEFEGMSTNKYSVSASTERGIRDNVKYTYTINNETKITTTCTPTGTEAVGLWQWVVSTRDSSIFSHSQELVCRHGDAARIAPRCPFTACANAQCTSCHAWMA